MKKITSIIFLFIICLMFTNVCYSEKLAKDVRIKYYINDKVEREKYLDYIFFGMDDAKILSNYKSLIDQSNLINIFENDRYLDYEKCANINFINKQYFLSIVLCKIVILNIEDVLRILEFKKEVRDNLNEIISIFEYNIKSVEDKIKIQDNNNIYLKFMEEFLKYYKNTETRGCYTKQVLYEKIQRL